MIKAAGYGVAMGNASPDVKAAADLVTTHIDDDGIYHAFLKMGLI
jgi:hydroxymethylpyrimidine pyrophosphatase-like HAD family hydrolase